ncbi:MAG: SHOCT domain-containing protein, partial [Jiangellaceae bacterium]
KMGEHAMQAAQERDTAMREYVQSVASSDGHGAADEIAKLADLRDRGIIDEAEFQRAKAAALS